MSAVRTHKILRARRQRRRRPPVLLIVAVTLASLTVIGATASVGFIFAMYNHYAEGYVPINQMIRSQTAGLTLILDRDGEPLGKLENPDAQLLDPVPLDQISKWMVEATVSTEDNEFWDHQGVNLRGLARAAWENYVTNEFGAGTGGSSITQQLIKNVYICPSFGEAYKVCSTGAERTLQRKLKEIAYALELEQDLSKEEILRYYLNQISYGDRYIGVQAAAQGYFGVSAADLTLAQAAVLAGIPSAPTKYHPRHNCVRDETTQDRPACILKEGRFILAEDAKARQEDVLDLMVRHGRITRDQAEAAKAEEIRVVPAANTVRAAAFIDKQVEPRLVRLCEAGLLPRLKGSINCQDSVHSAGYTVTTTLSLYATERARQLMQEQIAIGLDDGCECHNAAIVTIEPTTGQLIVYASTVDVDSIDPRIDGRIDQLTEINQPGSSFKPVVYLTWFDTQDKHPLSSFWDTSPLTVEGTAITNPRTGEKSEGLISARAGLGGSQNVPAFRAAQEAGPDNVIEMAKKLGITTLQQHFDPTWRNHDRITYGASIATGGANIRAVDMAYMLATVANMGKMVGTPHYARLIPDKLHSTELDERADYEKAKSEFRDFDLGHTRLPGTRELDPVVILRITDQDGNLVYNGDQIEERQVVDAGSVWLLHSIMSDCTARFVIWGCGGSNDDLRLDSFIESDGTRIPTGVKTGTQQGPRNAADTLETWMTGYSRYAATAVWVGNTNNDLVHDGPPGYQSANATVHLFKKWMGDYHSLLRDRFHSIEQIQGFDALRPRNVARRSIETVATDRVLGDKKGTCEQTVEGWVRTDVKYESECEEVEVDTRNGLLASDQTPAQFREKRKFVKLPEFKKDLALELAKEKKIPIAPTEKSTGQVAVAIISPTNGRTVSASTPVVGSVGAAGLTDWKLEIGSGSNPSSWKTLATGTTAVTNANLTVLDPRDYATSVYTLRLTATTAAGSGPLIALVTINIRSTPTSLPPGTTPTPGPGGGTGPPIITPTPTGNQP